MSGERLANDPVSKSAPVEYEGNLADPSVDVGGKLRAAREAKRLSIEDAAFALKLSPRQVAEIEANEWSGLPKSVIRGFVRNYARHLGVDPAQLMDGLEHMPLPQRPELRLDVGTPVSMPREGRADRKDYFRIIAGLIILMLALAAYLMLPPETWRSIVDRIKTVVVADSTQAPAGDDVPAGELAVEPVPVTPIPAAPVLPEPPVVPATPATPVAPVAPVLPEVPVEPPVPVPVAPVPLSSGAASPSVPPVLVSAAAMAPAVAEKPVAVPAGDEALHFSFNQPSWVEVRDRSGEIVFSQLNQAGSQREVTGRPPFSMVIGNASRVTLQFRGKPVDLMAVRSKGDVARLTVE